MAILVSAFELKKAFASRPLFDSITFAIESGERIGLIGPNGAGKTTLLKIIASQEHPDLGKITFQRGLKVGLLEQIPKFNPASTVEQTITEHLTNLEDWESIGRAHEIASRLKLDQLPLGLETPMAKLSGGWQKKAALARELAISPDLVLLDEPTNHLDLDSIIWLEEFLAHSRFATLTITHDRYFLQKVSNRILELDRRNPDGLLSVNGDYTAFLAAKEHLLESQASRETVLKNVLRRETEWLNRGAQARTTKQQARIQRHGELSKELAEVSYRNQNSKVRMDFTNTEKNPKKLVEAKKISLTRGEHKLFRQLDIVLRPGTRLGILGPNGCGKSSLIRTLLKSLPADEGEVNLSENLKVAYFEQNRESLDPEQSLQKTLCPSGEFVDYRGSRVHIRSYLDRFLFNPDQAPTAVGKLSGGEQSRVLLAKLMLEPANVLVLDEPTNDLDLSTLAVLEDCLIEFSGAVLLVTHDRFFLDQVATQILAFDVEAKDENRRVLPFADLNQWENWTKEQTSSQTSQSGQTPSPLKNAKPEAQQISPRPKKFGYKEQREWDQMEDKIHKLESEIESLNQKVNDPALASNAPKLLEATQALSEKTAELETLFERWGELEKMR